MSTHQIPLRWESSPRRGASVRTDWRMIPATTCADLALLRAALSEWLGLRKPIRVDPPRSFREGGTHPGINFFVFYDGEGGDPIGKITVAREGERFADLDPTDMRDFANLERS